MPSYSSDQFYKDWKYSIEKDFASPLGEPVKYAHNGFRTWGSEQHKILCSTPPGGASVNCDGSLIAVSIAEDMYIYNTTDFAEILVCRGHISHVDAFAFQPGNPKVLVSSAHNNYAGTHPVKPTIIVWNLDEQKENRMMKSSVILDIASQATETVVKNLLLAQPRLELSIEEKDSVTTAIEPAISRIIKTHNIANQQTLEGSLMSHFESETFSSSGSHLIYLPGQRPRSNGSDIWDIKVYSMSTHEDIFTLTGHTDAVMWTGYSPDEHMIGTVAWDHSIRIWEAKTGNQKYKFQTSGQNWTGGFSPDSQKFIGTCGDGSFYIYSMIDGTTLVHDKSNSPGWMRALSWSPDNTTVAIGKGRGTKIGRFILYDTEKKEIIQERILSTQACPGEADYRRMIGNFLECCAVQFVDGGRKVVVLTSGDCGIETYDLKTWEKWRFARPGVDPEFEEKVKKTEEDSGESFDENHEKKVKNGPLAYGGYSMAIWEVHNRSIICIASLDGDAVRIWEVPMTKEKKTVPEL